jgi:superfamily II DNA or RNA helicase
MSATCAVLRPHQEEDLKAMINNRQGVIIGATGCGKTRSQAAYIHHYFSNTENPKPCVVVAPTISLVNQLTEEYFKFFHQHHKMSIQAFTLFSSKNDADWDEDITPNLQFDFGNLSTSNSKSLIGMYHNHVEKCCRDNAVVPVIIFTTYKSLYKLSTIDVRMKLAIHCVMFDEAHNLYRGSLQPVNRAYDAFTVIADKKFYFTATPPGDEEADTELFNEANHGKIIALHTHYDMAVAGDVLPFRLMFLKDPQLAAISTDDVLTYEQHAEIILKAFNKLHQTCGTPTKMLVMLRDSLEVKNIAEALAEMRTEVNVYATAAGTWIGDLHNGKEIGRKALLKQLKEHANENAIILNVRVLGEGIDVKGINGTLFIAGGSEIKINQNSGRAARLNDIDRSKVYAGELTPIKDVDKYVKPFGWIIVPDYGIDGSATSAEVIKVITALRKQGAYIHDTATVVHTKGAETERTGRVSKGAPDTSLIDIDVRTILEDLETALRLEADEAARQELKDKINKMGTDELVAFIGGLANQGIN